MIRFGKSGISKQVILTIEEGVFEEGFRAKLQIQHKGQLLSEVSGYLPPNPEIGHLCCCWQILYHQFEECSKNRPNLAAIANASQSLIDRLNHWLSSYEFQPLRDSFIEEVKRDENALIILQTQNIELQQFPWHLCDLFQRYEKAEIVLGTANPPPILSTSKRYRTKMRILAILGNSVGIEVEKDKKFFQDLPDAQVEFLVEPKRQELNEFLWEKWDIISFSGHSANGKIHINSSETLAVDDLEKAFKQSIKSGLQLAIINGCDGLKLARDLLKLGIPIAIGMREYVPDLVAQAFLKYFLKAFSQGMPFYLSVRQAREKLQGMEGEFPCASWLPVIVQNPAAVMLYWAKPQHWQLPLGGAITILLLSIIGWNLWSSRMSLGDKILIKEIITPEKLKGVEAFQQKDFEAAAKYFQASLQKFPNDPETRIYLNNSQTAQSQRFLRIAVGVPVCNNLSIAQEILRGIAQAQESINQEGGINNQLLQVQIADDCNDPIIAQALAVTFVMDRQILAVIASNASDASVAAAPIYNWGGLVMISPTSFSDKLAASGDYIFKIIPNIGMLGNLLAQYAIQQNITKIGICYDARAVDNEGFQRNFRSAFNVAGGEIVSEKCDFSDAENLEKSYMKIAQLNAQAVLLAPHVNRIHEAVKVIKVNDSRLKLLGSPTLYTSKTYEAGASLEGLVLPSPWYPSTNSDDIFLKESQKLWGGSVTWRTVTSYDVTQVLIAGLREHQTRFGLKNILKDENRFSVDGAGGKKIIFNSGERILTKGMIGLVEAKATLDRSESVNSRVMKFVPLKTQ